jgi:50S ribosomal protein L16 3-hydroxylase
VKLNNFDIETFLRDTWQQKPLLIRNAFSDWSNPLSPDELAGLACEAEVESRLVTGANGSWAVEQGPLPADRFEHLDKSPWTLLVQAVDHHVPDVAALLSPFRFIPNWRIDDVMVSYASEGGGVGPHFDQYDVFLIQGQGRRRWRVGQHCNADSALLPNEDLCLLAGFDATDEWILEPGDMLYVPPGIAHDGIAVGDDCMTYSIGFRAPSRRELITDFADHLVAEMDDDDRYADPGLPMQSNSGEITADALAALHTLIAEKLADREAFARWFGGYNSIPKYPEIDWRPERTSSTEDVREMLRAGATLTRNPASRFSFIRKGADVLLFVDGECFECGVDSSGFAEQLCADDVIELAPAFSKPDAVLSLITQLVNQGSIAVEASE